MKKPAVPVKPALGDGVGVASPHGALGAARPLDREAPRLLDRRPYEADEVEQLLVLLYG